MRKIYTSTHLDPTKPQTLQNKVQMDIRFFFCRRANENIDVFTKETFAIEQDSDTGLRYVVKIVDEVTKNHQIDSEMVTACMPEMQGSPNCPVMCFEKYLSKLDPTSKWLWQYTKEKYTESGTWYNGKKIGSNPLSKFMGYLSKELGLSKKYTNHSIRVTATTFLGRNESSGPQ